MTEGVKHALPDWLFDVLVSISGATEAERRRLAMQDIGERILGDAELAFDPSADLVVEIQNRPDCSQDCGEISELLLRLLCHLVDGIGEAINQLNTCRSEGVDHVGAEILLGAIEADERFADLLDERQVDRVFRFILDCLAQSLAEFGAGPARERGIEAETFC